MSGDSKIVITRHYGYICVVGVGSVFLNFWLGMNVGCARRRYGIEYPIVYHSGHHLFNCIIRAHHNTLESYPQFLMLLFLGGLDYPRACSLAGVVWILGRIVFARGYYTGEPGKRVRGAFGYFGMLALLWYTIRVSSRILKGIPSPFVTALANAAESCNGA